MFPWILFSPSSSWKGIHQGRGERKKGGKEGGRRLSPCRISRAKGVGGEAKKWEGEGVLINGWGRGRTRKSFDESGAGGNQRREGAEAGDEGARSAGGGRGKNERNVPFPLFRTIFPLSISVAVSFFRESLPPSLPPPSQRP